MICIGKTKCTSEKGLLTSNPSCQQNTVLALAIFVIRRKSFSVVLNSLCQNLDFS